MQFGVVVVIVVFLKKLHIFYKRMVLGAFQENVYLNMPSFYKNTLFFFFFKL